MHCTRPVTSGLRLALLSPPRPVKACPRPPLPWHSLRLPYRAHAFPLGFIPLPHSCRSPAALGSSCRRLDRRSRGAGVPALLTYLLLGPLGTSWRLPWVADRRRGPREGHNKEDEDDQDSRVENAAAPGSTKQRRGPPSLFRLLVLDPLSFRVVKCLTDCPKRTHIVLGGLRS